MGRYLDSNGMYEHFGLQLQGAWPLSVYIIKQSGCYNNNVVKPVPIRGDFLALIRCRFDDKVHGNTEQCLSKFV